MNSHALKGVDFVPETVNGIFCPQCYCQACPSKLLQQFKTEQMSKLQGKKWYRGWTAAVCDFLLVPGFSPLICCMIFCGSRSLPVLWKTNSLLTGDVAEDKLRVAKCLAITEG